MPHLKGNKIKKVLTETQTLRASCSKAEPKKFISPHRRPPSRGRGRRDGQNLISWRWSLPLPTNPVCWGSMHAISSYCGNRPTRTRTQTPTHSPTHRQDRLQYTALQLAHSVIKLQYRRSCSNKGTWNSPAIVCKQSLIECYSDCSRVCYRPFEWTSKILIFT